MSLKKRNGIADDEQAQVSESASGGLYGGYPEALLRSKSRGGCSSDLSSDMVKETKSAQEFRAENRRQASLPAAGNSERQKDGSTLEDGDDISQIKIMAKEMKPDDLDDLVKTLLKIRDDREGGRDGAPIDKAHMENMEATNRMTAIRSRLDFGSGEEATEWTNSQEDTRPAGNQTRDKSLGSSTREFFGEMDSGSQRKRKSQDLKSYGAGANKTDGDLLYGTIREGSLKSGWNSTNIPSIPTEKTDQFRMKKNTSEYNFENNKGDLEKPSLKLDSLIKQLGTKLAKVDHFEVWKKGVKDIGRYRRWPSSFTEMHSAEEILSVNIGMDIAAREEAYFVLKSTIAQEYHYLLDSIDINRVEEMWRVICIKFDKMTTYHQGMKVQKFCCSGS